MTEKPDGGNSARKRSEFAQFLQDLVKSPMLLAAIGASIGIISSLVSFGYFRPMTYDDLFLSRFTKIAEDTSTLSNEVAALAERFRTIEATDLQLQPSHQIALLQVDIKHLTERLGHLESGLLGDPQKALSLPMMRLDLDALKQRYQSDQAEIVRSMDRIYDQNKWFLGLMITVVLSLTGLAIGSSYRRKSA